MAQLSFRMRRRRSFNELKRAVAPQVGGDLAYNGQRLASGLVRAGNSHPAFFASRGRCWRDYTIFWFSSITN